MLNALKARLRASVCLTLTAEAWREVIKAFALMIYRLVRPGTVFGQRIGCTCPSKVRVYPGCTFHGLEARRLIHG